MRHVSVYDYFPTPRPTNLLKSTARRDCVGSCACERPRSHCRIVDGDIASGCASAPFRLSSVHSLPPPQTHSLRYVCGICAFWCRHFGDFESGRYFLNTQRDRRHRTYCAAFRFPVSIFGGSAECIGRWECEDMRVCACGHSFSSSVLSDQYTYHIHRYNAPRLGLVHRVCASAHGIGGSASVKNRPDVSRAV